MNKKLPFVIALLLISLFTSQIVNAVFEKNNFENFDMIIITPLKYSSYIQVLVEHKNNHNIKTKPVILDEIYKGTYFSVQGRDDQEKIKYFVKNSIENWKIKYILFIGNSDQIPIRYCYNYDNYSNYPEYKFISELYYADIYDVENNFSSWDSDQDCIFGEWAGETAEDKQIDLKPDVCIGRLPCENKEEVTVMIKKIINYEENQADSSWFKKIIVVGGDTYKQFQGYEGEIYNQMALDAMTDFTAVKLWSSINTLTKFGRSIIKAINHGAGFVYFSGHGSKRIWQTNYPNGSWAGRFTPLQMFFLLNKNKLPVCVVEGCHNSEFTTKENVEQEKTDQLLNIQTKLKECWSWVLTSKKIGGSIATIGSTGLCWYSAEYEGAGTNYLSLQFFKQYANGTTTLGDLWKNAITVFLDNNEINWETQAGGTSSIDAKTVEEWVLLGDPSLKIGGFN